MKTYQYQIIRYVHDQFTGEFVNLGVIVYSSDDFFLKCIVSAKYGRITALFPQANGRFITKILKNFETSIKNISKELSEIFKPSASLNQITNSVLPKDDSALMLTEVKYGIDVDLETCLNDLYANLVEKYIHSENTIQSITDEEVWKKKYKAYFDKYQITNRLTNHEIITKHDHFNFEKSWKNEIWHCYEPISFDLQNEDSIKDKVYRWAGRLNEIEKNKEKIHLTFLAQYPKQHKKLESLIKESLDHDTDYLEIEIFSENEAENVAKKISELMLEHDSHN